MSDFDEFAAQAADLAAEDAAKTELYQRTLFLLDGLVIMERLHETPPVEQEAAQLANAYRALLSDAPAPDADRTDLAEPGPHPPRGPHPIDIDVT